MTSMRIKNGITVCHGAVDWVADSMKNAPLDKEMSYRYKEIKNIRTRKTILSLTKDMRKMFPKLTREMLNGKMHDVVAHLNGDILVATLPRPYEEWIYDCAKSDIVVRGKEGQKKEILRKFEEEKKDALQRKSKLNAKLKIFKATLNRLAKAKLVDGIIGRGSYFDVNGYPGVRDDIDLLFLLSTVSAEIEHKIFKILRSAPKGVGVNIVRRNENTIKKGSPKFPVFSIIIVTKKSISSSLGTKYERYVLERGIGIALPNLSKKTSEEVARRFASLLPSHDMRPKYKLSRLPPKKR